MTHQHAHWLTRLAEVGRREPILPFKIPEFVISLFLARHDRIQPFGRIRFC